MGLRDLSESFDMYAARIDSKVSSVDNRASMRRNVSPIEFFDAESVTPEGVAETSPKASRILVIVHTSSFIGPGALFVMDISYIPPPSDVLTVSSPSAYAKRTPLQLWASLSKIADADAMDAWPHKPISQLGVNHLML